MADIHRLLCTHCTFGTSELESSSAENAGKVLGYSVRKSSLPDAERGQLLQVFRAVERLLSYGLPKDATAAHKESLSADTAPRQLIFFPNLGGWQVAGQVSYRTFDTSQPPRPGSYFADLIVAKGPDPRSRDPEPSWSPCDVLQLWGVGFDRKTKDHAGWWISSEDELAAAEAEGPWKPIAPTIVAAVREPCSPLIDDDTAHRFLSSEGVVADPLVPARWWAMPAERRRELVAHMLQATIQGPARGGRETVTIAAEPSVAAILFYIVCRLLPRQIAAGVSFSTYEPAPERPLTGLVATTFLNEEAPTADLPPELAQRGFACNTFREGSNYGRCQPPPEQGYARRLVALAVANDWVEIDSLLAALDAEGLKAADLDQLIKIDHLVTAYFDGEKPTGLAARRGPQEARFLRERFRGVLETQAATKADWPPDLLEASIFCLEGDLEILWTESEPVRALLTKHLPTDGEGLGRLLEPRNGTPTPPRAIVAAAVVSATLREKPPHLPERFIKYCQNARKERNRAAAVDLLREVIRSLPEGRREALLVDAGSASLADLLLDVARKLSQIEQSALQPTLTESLSRAVKKLTAQDLEGAAELLHRQADAASWVATDHPRLREHLDVFFDQILTQSAGNQTGRHLIDSAGRSRVAKLQLWANHAFDRNRIGQTLAHWRRLHEAFMRLAAEAPPWRPWMKPQIPAGNDVGTAVAAINNLQPFQLGRSIDSRKRQQVLAAAVVQTFTKALPEGSELRSGWETVGHWLERALEEEANRKAPPPERARTQLSLGRLTAVGVALALVAAVAAIGISWLSFPTEIARKDAPATDPSPTERDQPANEASLRDTTIPRPGANPLRAKADGTQVAKHDGPHPSPPPTAQDIALSINPKDGFLKPNWNTSHELLKGAPIAWKAKGPLDKTDVALPDPDAGFNTENRGFGEYCVTVCAKLKTGETIRKNASFELKEPAWPKVSTCTLAVADGKPSLKLTLTSASPIVGRYGPMEYTIRWKNNPQWKHSLPVPPRTDGASSTTLEVPLDPAAFAPADFLNAPPQFTIKLEMLQGPVGPVNFEAQVDTDVARRIVTDFGKSFSRPLDQEPTETNLLTLPWSLLPDRFDLWLMTPAFTAGTAVKLKQKEKSVKAIRWHCEGQYSSSGAQQDSATLTIGHFELLTDSPWQPQLRFKPASHRDEGFKQCYAALRCCKLCLVIDGRPIATCQMLPVLTKGSLLVSLPEGVPVRTLRDIALPPSLAWPKLEFGPCSAQGGEFTLDIATHDRSQKLIVARKEEPLTEAKLEFQCGVPTLSKSIWATSSTRRGKPYESTVKSEKRNQRERKSLALRRAKDDIKNLKQEQADLEKFLNDKKPEELADHKKQRSNDLQSKLIPDEEKKRDIIQKLIDDLNDDLSAVADVEAVNAARFNLKQWSIFVDTPLQSGTKPEDIDGEALDSRVVIVEGSANDPPIEFVEPPPAKSTDLPDPAGPGSRSQPVAPQQP